MTDFTRRDFLKVFLAVAGPFAVSGEGTSIPEAGDNPDPLEFLVVGDSIVWGQGLDEKEKAYTLIRDWLGHEAFGERRAVNLKVKAHSGATLKFHEDEAEKYRRAGRDETYFFKPEVGVAFPSVWKQIEVAADEYTAAGKSLGADFILLNGGITDITAAKILDPHGDNPKLHSQIEKYCGDQMFDVFDIYQT